MAERKSAAGRKKRTPTAAEIAAGSANLARGRKSTEERRKKAKEMGLETGPQRWARLLDGSLTVRDLDDDEIKNMYVRNADGGFAGKRRTIPSHIAQQFHSEAIRRSNDRLRSAAPEAVQALIDIGKNPAVKESDRVRALMYVVDRALGKTPETMVVKAEDRFADLLGDAIVEDRDLGDMSPVDE